jgi:hypothetical protein
MRFEEQPHFRPQPPVPLTQKGGRGGRKVERVEKKQESSAVLMDIGGPQDVSREAKDLVRSFFPRFDFSSFDKMFADIIRLFRGELPGYRQCNIRYHDLRHTMLITLAMARLIHGALVEKNVLCEKDISLGLLSALTHDTGYIQTTLETTGTGAQFTLIHIGRSIEFVRHCFSDDGDWKGDLKRFADILSCTGLNTKISSIHFASPETELLGKMLGTADLLGQMSDRFYLEKLRFLYREFREGGVQGFDSEVDLLEKTLGFYEDTKSRFVRELGDTRRFMLSHFKSRYGIDRDLYSESIARNMAYLDYVVTNHREEYAHYLRRDSLSLFLPSQP